MCDYKKPPAYIRQEIFILVLFDFAKSLVATLGTSADSFAHVVDRSVEVMPFGLKFGVALGANKGLGHNYNISQNQNYRNGNGYNVPLDVSSLSKPIYLAGCEREG